MRPTAATTLLFAATITALTGAIARAVTTEPTTPAATRQARIARGEYLVSIMGCHDCHTPFVEGPNGWAPDMSRALTGHPGDVVMPPPPPAAGRWNVSATTTNTAWAGPWGVSFTANLTPDPETGLGRWTEEMFVATMRTGRHEGKGRPLLPPMPYPNLAALTDEDIRSLFAYLQSRPPVRNRVPAPVDPPEEQR